LVTCVCSYYYDPPRDPHSFPTRRSSDLGIVPPDNYWPGLREVTRSRGVFLIADEVMSAFGRCGEWFAWQRYGDAGKPDLMTLARSEEHTSELQSPYDLVCRLLLEKKKKK